MKFSLKYILISSLIIYSCSSSDDITERNECKLTSYKAAQLYYDYFDRQDLGLRVGFNIDFNGVQLEYDSQDRINKAIGGPVLVPTGSNLTEWILSNGIEYNIDYSGNSVSITSAIESFLGDTINEYTINNGIITDRSIILPNGLFNEKIDFTYNYLEYKILEYKNDVLFRTFFIENNNLVKIEELIYHDINNPLEESDILYAKYEIIFSEFDNLPNLLEGKFFLDGAFFKAFSKNNYHKVSLDYYLFNQNTQEFQLESLGENFRSYNFGTNNDGSSRLFTTDCIIEN